MPLPPAITAESIGSGHGDSAGTRRSPWRGRIALLVKFLVAAGLLAWLFSSGRLQLARFTTLRISWSLAGLIALSVGTMLLPMVRWWWLLRLQHLHEPLSRVLALSWASNFFGLVLPGAASSDIAKSYLILRRRPSAKARAFSTVLADRFLGLYSLLFLGLLAVAWLASRGEMEPGVQLMAASIAALFIGMTCVAGCLLVVPTRTLLLRVLPKPWREAWDQSFKLYRANRWPLVGCFLLSILSSAMTFASFTLAGAALGEFVPWSASFAAGPLVVLGNCLPLTPGGIGTAEALSSELFACFNVHQGAAMMVLVRVMNAILTVPGVVVFLQLPSPSESFSSPPRNQE